MTNTKKPRVDGLLPAEVRKWLMNAYATKDPRHRLRAIEDAMIRARRQYPEYFNPEEETAS